MVKDDAHEEVQGLSDEEIDMILDSYDDKQFAQWRDKTLVLLLLDTGLRINEAMSLTAEQVDFHQNTLLVPSSIAKNR
ncbi:site-specific integrase [Bacillus salipaludis]|uniref:Site-specific integrase n=1 Tax=Bacillus salipaludis TaxID=2547811 RepID=A0A4R5VJY9_9BACI|nr:tyrosine-type recombinase/integrase [Bacillus salipaludis]TDK58208.1 site-specific integrase [Bacillus salipaludis]